MRNRIVLSSLLLCSLAACDVDKNHPKYDQLRYDELQKTSCNEMASVLSAASLMEKPEEFEVALKRCQDTQSLSFEEYKALADHGRETGSWDLYEVYPEKR